MPAALAAKVYHAAQLSLADGMRAVLYGMAVTMGIAGIVAIVGLRRGIHVAADAVAAEPGTEPGAPGVDHPAADPV